MKDSNRPKDFLTQALPVLVIGAVPLAAFLAFAIQPMMGKRLLPIYGGTSGTWLGCMVYFQFALLLGYSWAAWLTRKTATFQMTATIALAVVAVVTFHLPSDEIAEGAGILRVVWRLSLASLPAMILLFSASPLLHGWLRRQGDEVPYYLYAISNAGSLIALLLYPFVIETNLGLGDQTFFWHGFLVLVAAALGIAGYIFKHTSSAYREAAEPDEPLTPGMVVAWLVLSALTCVGMLGATYHIVAEIGSTPLAWVGPFGLYLLSFMLTFSGRWRRWMTLTALVALSISLTVFMLRKGFTVQTVNGWTALWLLGLTASGSFLGNALLHSLRPVRRFERFYLVLAAGGVIGGLLSSTMIPYLLNRPAEFILASAALLATGVVWLIGRREPSTLLVIGSVLVIPVLGVGIQQIHRETVEFPRGYVHSRDLYGHVSVRTDERFTVMASDTTTMGSQLTFSDAARRRPTMYFTESTGGGRVFEKLKAANPEMTVGVVGLGTATFAAYARNGDTYDFFDIDPKAIRVATGSFTYVVDARSRGAKVNLILRDGRKAFDDSKTNYDLIIIDAFTGDGVPSHLLTREAMAIYSKRLAAKNGLLVVHSSMRYSRYFPVVEATARSLNLSAVSVHTDIKHDVTEAGKERDWDPTSTDYIIISKPEMTKDIVTWFPDTEDNGRVLHTVNTVTSPLVNSALIWTDDRNAAIDVLDLSRYFAD